jgi:hypothetical protein
MMKHARQTRAWWKSLAAAAWLALPSAACVDSLDMQPAQQEYLCGQDAAAEWQARLEACQASSECAGLFSLSGRLEGKDVSVGTELTQAVFYTALLQADGNEYLDRFDLFGTSAYFSFDFKVYSLGSPPGPGAATDRSLLWSTSAASLIASTPAEFADDLVRGDLRIENGRENVELHAVEGSGSLLVASQDASSIAGTLSGSFASPDDHVDGCFAATATQTKRNLR